MSEWKDFVTAALIGTDKGAPPPLPVELGHLAAATVSRAPAERLLREAGAYALWRRAGRRPARSTATIEPATAETRPLVSAASAGHLRALLAAREGDLLEEWLTTVKDLGRRVPPESLPPLFKLAQANLHVRALIAEVGGQRALWLANYHPQGKYVRPPSLDLWETGEGEQRAEVLRHWRETDPSFGRAQLERGWANEGPGEASILLKQLTIGLSVADELFLEKTLDSRNVHVRATAIDCLSRLATSGLTQRMTARAEAVLDYQRGRLLARNALQVQLAPAPDAAAVRDGIDPRILLQKGGLGERALQLFLLLSTVPPAHWSQKFQETPTALLKALEKNEFARAVVTGFAVAACRHRDADWARAILDGAIAPIEGLLSKSLFAPLPVAEAEDRLTQMICENPPELGNFMAWAGLRDKGRGLSRYLSEKNARKVLAFLRQRAARGFPRGFAPVGRMLQHWLPPAVLAEATEGWPQEEEGVAAFVEFATLRRTVLDELERTGPAPASSPLNPPAI